jgi:2-amino-4-hydroxy-6-hydroxymethyldihydropteridine diphosphokinase
MSLSSPYESEPVGMDSKNWFINAVGVLKCNCLVKELLDILLEIEKEFGRTRQSDYHGHQDRTIDMDILFYDKMIVDTPDLQLPHPEMHNRLFVLMPLAELAPNLFHPVQLVTVETLTKQLLLRQEKPVCHKLKGERQIVV